MVGMVFGGLALGGLWLAAGHLLGIMRDISHAVPQIGVMAIMGAVLFASLALAMMAAMMVLQPDQRRQRGIWWAIAACLPGFVIGPVGVSVVAGSTLSARGYDKCRADIPGVRFVTHWARSATACLAPG